MYGVCSFMLILFGLQNDDDDDYDDYRDSGSLLNICFFLFRASGEAILGTLKKIRALRARAGGSGYHLARGTISVFYRFCNVYMFLQFLTFFVHSA